MTPDRNGRARRRGQGALLWALVLLFAGSGLVLAQGSDPGHGQAPTKGEEKVPKKAAGGAGGTQSQIPPGRPAEDVAAVVGNTPILRSEVEDQVQAAAEQTQTDLSDTAASNQLHRQVLEHMINQQILLLEADSENIKVSDEEVQKAVDDEIENNVRQLGGRDAFDEELKKEGLTEQELRSRYHDQARKEMLTTRVIQKNIQPKVPEPDTKAMRDWFDKNRSQIPKKPRQIHIQDLFIATTADSAIEQRARENALDVRKKILAGMPFAEAAKTYSDDPRGKEGGSLGRMARGQLDQDLDEAAFALKVGEVSQPVRSRYGYHLLTVTGRDSDWVDVSHILFSVPTTKADEVAARERADALYGEISSGKIDFGEAIRKDSDDPESRSRDGDMGWIPYDNIFGEMKQAVDSLRVGQLSRPVAGDGGYHIFKVLGEQAESEYTFDEIRDQVKQAVVQEGVQDQLKVWLDQLRKKYFVETRAHW